MNKYTVNLTREHRERAFLFALKRKEGSERFYRSRGGFKIEDIMIGAMAEMAVHRLLRRAGLDVSPPDFEIYQAKDKSFDADLSDGTRFFHVKGQSLKSAEVYGTSWLIQKEDKTFQNPERMHYLVGCLVDLSYNKVHIYCCTPLVSVKDNKLIELCKKDYLNKSKRALYLSSITKKLSTGQKWGVIYDYIRGNK